jgi:hypothetical protein
MIGDDRIRFCPLCQKNVYNLSGMTRQDAEALVRNQEGHLCIRFHRRRDGTILTDHCPVGLRAAQRKLVFLVGGVAALFVFIYGWLPWIGTMRFDKEHRSRLGPREIVERIKEWFNPTPPAATVLGAMCPPDSPPEPGSEMPEGAEEGDEP